MDNTADLVLAIATVGKQNASWPDLRRLEPFGHFFLTDGSLDNANLDSRDGACTRRDLILRFLVLNAVLDQGPDIAGVRKMLTDVTNMLYRREVRFLHRPAAFFEELGLAVDQILEEHQNVKDLRAVRWAEENKSNAVRYNLFMDNSRQVLNYAIFRWGVPLALPVLLHKDCKDEDHLPTVLSNYLETYSSAEAMSQMLKDHERYGLGKAIGDKACHLFAKWAVSSFRLTKRTDPYVPI